MQLFCAAVCFLFTSGTPLQARNSGGRGAILRLTYTFSSLLMFHYKHGTRLRLRQPCLLRYASLFITKFYVGRYLAPLPFQSGVVLVTLRSFVHLRPFLKAAVLHHFPSGVGLDGTHQRLDE